MVVPTSLWPRKQGEYIYRRTPPSSWMTGLPAPASRAPSGVLHLLKATYLTEGETPLYESHPTRWIFLVGPVTLLVVALAANLVLWRNVVGSPVPSFGVLPAIPSSSLLKVPYPVSSWPVILGVLLLLAGVLFFAVRYFRWIRTVYVVTSTRIIRQRGIFTHDYDEIQLGQVRGVEIRTGVGQRILGYGTVRLSAEAVGTNDMANETWPGLPHPLKFQRIIESAQQALRNPRPPGSA
jgi:hypothetical protein